MLIPFNRPYLTGNELRYMEDVIQSFDKGGHISGDGKYTKLVQDFFQSEFDARKVLLTTSCTSALELATYLLDLRPKGIRKGNMYQIPLIRSNLIWKNV